MAAVTHDLLLEEVEETQRQARHAPKLCVARRAAAAVRRAGKLTQPRRQADQALRQITHCCRGPGQQLDPVHGGQLKIRPAPRVVGVKRRR